MDEVAARESMMIEQLERELQQQKGMLWLLGEIMKAANNINSFKELMKVLTDMLMGVTGVDTCYLWAYNGERLKVYLRSTEMQNEFKELSVTHLPEAIKQCSGTYMFSKREIKEAMVVGGQIPGSRLAVPLFDFNNNHVIGALVLEHQQEKFFTASNIIFFETLAIFIASNTKNSTLYKTIAEQSERDPLTGTYNRRYLEKALASIIDTAHKMTIAVIDTDNFKLVNDILGHIKGDEVIQAVAKTAQNYFGRYNGEIVRYGGDEFVILLPIESEEAICVLSEFQQMIPNIPEIVECEIPVTITMGVCSYPEMTKNTHMLIKSADRALLRGKEQGKNRVIIATEEDLEVV